MAISTSVSTAVAQTVSFLTRPLMQAYPAAIIGKLQLVLEANLTAHYAPSWTPHAPLNGSGRRCISFSQDCLPPRVVYSACLAAGVQWFDWIKLLGIHEFDLLVDPGCVYIRIGNDMMNIWTAEPQDVMAPIPHIRVSTHTTVAQQLLQDDDADAAIFELIADEMNAPTWKTPMMERFPIPRVSSPFSTLSSVSSHSRSSSRSSNYSSVFSDSDSSTSSSSTSTSYSRREKTKVFVDTTKTEVTPYDGGKTTVLTGGVMLGGAAASKAKHPKAPTGNWRCVRVSA